MGLWMLDSSFRWDDRLKLIASTQNRWDIRSWKAEAFRYIVLACHFDIVAESL
jgi:hypothetical protein